MPTYVVTGASRGIGLGLVTHLAATEGNVVIATARDPSTAALLELEKSTKGKLHILQLDVGSPESIEKFTSEVAKSTSQVDYLINNAGVNLSGDSETAANLKVDILHEQIQINVVGPALVTQHLQASGLLKSGAVVMNTTSGLSSCKKTVEGFGPKALGYSITKAALNMLTTKQATLWTDITFFTVDPGWVKTSMGGPNAMITVDESVSGLLKLIHSRTKEHSGGFFLYNGDDMPY